MSVFTFQQLGVFGKRRSGKTSAVRQIGAGLARHGRRTLYLNPTGERWPEWALNFTDRDKFIAAADRLTGCFVVFDEAGDTVARDPDLTRLFTRIGHRGHLLAVSGHDLAQLLPVQRDQFDALMLFRAGARCASMLGEEWSDPRFSQVTQLVRYQFLFARAFGAEDGQHFITPGIFPPP